MEFMPRGSLWGFLASRGRGFAGAGAAAPALSAVQQRSVALDIACGLAYLHAIPILHLDLKVSAGGPFFDEGRGPFIDEGRGPSFLRPQGERGG